MTTTEALDLLSVISERTFSAHKQAHLQRSSAGEYRYLTYVVYAHPGYDGSKCQQFTSPDGFDKPVADCLALAKSVAATENNE